MKQLHFVWLFLLMSTLAACSGLKTYPNNMEKNLVVRTTLSGPMFNSLKAYLHVYDPKNDCTLKYLGSIRLKNGESEVGVAAGREVSLDFVIHATELFSPEAHLHNRAIVTLRPGVRYVAIIRYVDRIYSVSLRELGSTGLPGREIPLKGIPCSPVKIVNS